MDWLLDMLGLNKGKGTIDAANQNKDVLSQLGIDLNSIIDSTSAQQQGYLGQANNLASVGPNGAGMIGNALGLNGDAGKEQALSAFQDFNPGFDFALNTGLDALDRRANSRGMLNSGNTNIDTLDYANGLANQNWNSWLGNLTGAVDRNIGTLGDMATQAGNTGNTRLAVTGDLASGQMGANNQIASGKEAGQGSLWDLLGNVAGVAGSFMGMGGGFGGGGSTGIPSSTPGAKLGYGGGF